jgi:hypothetical protein
MNVIDLIPRPFEREAFRRDRLRYVPDCPGCYALATFSGTVLYVGLAKSLRRRMNDHLDSPRKTGETAHGRAILAYWITTEDLQRVERTWMNMHQIAEGRLPILNQIYSPVST